MRAQQRFEALASCAEAHRLPVEPERGRGGAKARMEMAVAPSGSGAPAEPIDGVRPMSRARWERTRRAYQPVARGDADAGA